MSSYNDLDPVVIEHVSVRTGLDPRVKAARLQQVEEVIAGMGDTWLLHPNNHVKKLTRKEKPKLLLEKWMEQRRS